MANFQAVASGDWNVGATWGNAGDNTEGSGWPSTNDTAEIDSANKSGGQGAIDVALVADVTLKALKLYSNSGSHVATISAAAERTITCSNSHFSGYCWHISGYTDLDGTINLKCTRNGTVHHVIDNAPMPSSHRAHDVTVDGTNAVLYSVSNLVISGKLTIAANQEYVSQHSGGGTSYRVEVGEEINISGTLTTHASVVQAANMEINSGGTYSATTGTTTITANSGGSTSGRAYWSHTGGTLKHNFGTFAFTNGSPQVEPGGPNDPSDQVATSAHTFWNVTCTGGFLPKTQRMVIANDLTTAGDIGYNGNNYWMEVHGTWKHTAGTTNNSDTCQSTRGYARNFVLDGTGELDLKTTNMTFGSFRNISSSPVTGVANQ